MEAVLSILLYKALNKGTSKVTYPIGSNPASERISVLGEDKDGINTIIHLHEHNDIVTKYTRVYIEDGARGSLTLDVQDPNNSISILLYTNKMGHIYGYRWNRNNVEYGILYDNKTDVSLDVKDISQVTDPRVRSGIQKLISLSKEEDILYKIHDIMESY